MQTANFIFNPTKVRQILPFLLKIPEKRVCALNFGFYDIMIRWNRIVQMYKMCTKIMIERK